MNNLYKLFCKCLLFAIIIVIVDCLIGKGLKSIGKYALLKNPHNIHMKTPYMVEKANEDILIIGASDASHHYISQMIEDSTGYSTYNCGQDGSSFLYQSCLIHLVLKRYSPKIIIWQFSPIYISTASYDKDYSKINYLYQYYDDEYLKQVIDNKNWSQKIKMNSNMYRYNSMIINLLHDVSIKQNFNKGYIPLETNSPKASLTLESIDLCEINTDKVEILINTIELCKKNGVELIFSNAPSMYQFCMHDTPHYMYFLSIAKENRIPVIESRIYKHLFQDPKLYKDAGHLNDNGAKLWTECFITELKAIME